MSGAGGHEEAGLVLRLARPAPGQRLWRRPGMDPRAPTSHHSTMLRRPGMPHLPGMTRHPDAPQLRGMTRHTDAPQQPGLTQ